MKLNFFFFHVHLSCHIMRVFHYYNASLTVLPSICHGSFKQFILLWFFRAPGNLYTFFWQRGPYARRREVGTFFNARNPKHHSSTSNANPISLKRVNTWTWPLFVYLQLCVLFHLSRFRRQRNVIVNTFRKTS